MRLRLIIHKKLRITIDIHGSLLCTMALQHKITSDFTFHWISFFCPTETLKGVTEAANPGDRERDSGAERGCEVS